MPLPDAIANDSKHCNHRCTRLYGMTHQHSSCAGNHKFRGFRRGKPAVDDEDANNAAYVPTEEEQEDEDGDEDENEEENASPKKRCCWRTAWLNTLLGGMCSVQLNDLGHTFLHGRSARRGGSIM